jgi:hypothetical protein
MRSKPTFGPLIANAVVIAHVAGLLWAIGRLVSRLAFG